MNRINRKKLKLLADYLNALPEGYTHFDMSEFNSDQVETINNSNHCKTAACALGHAPYVKGLPKLGALWAGSVFPKYSERVFGLIQGENKWNWLFSATWEHIDNTPHGAAKRIYWLLEHGIPENWEDKVFDDREPFYQ